MFNFVCATKLIRNVHLKFKEEVLDTSQQRFFWKADCKEILILSGFFNLERNTLM